MTARGPVVVPRPSDGGTTLDPGGADIVTSVAAGVEPVIHFVRRSRADHVARALALPADPVTGCMVWDGALTPRGYGRVKFESRSTAYPVHRLVLEHHLGRRLAPDEVTRHTCDNPPCVNPAHLLAGTQADNVHDRDERHRRIAPVGEAHGYAILTDEIVLKARRSYDAGATIDELVAEFGLTVHPTTLCLAVKGRTWRHLPGACTMRPGGWRR